MVGSLVELWLVPVYTGCLFRVIGERTNIDNSASTSLDNLAGVALTTLPVLCDPGKYAA